MGSRKTGHPRGPSLSRAIHSTRVHLTLYSLLLVVTPFIMLRNFLQQAIGHLSLSTFSVLGRAIPVVPSVAAIVAVLLLAFFRPRITLRRVFALLVGLAMIAVAQRITDYYFGHRFYELQVNWHYIAYSIFAFMAYRHLRPRGASLARCLLITFGLATLYSTFDEGFQLAVTSRIFDTSDIAKDTWGALTGLTVLLVGGVHPELARGAWKRIRRPTLRGYFTNAPSTWVLLFALALFFLTITSLFAGSEYCGTVLLLTIPTFAAFFAILHLSQFRLWGRLLLALALVGLLAQGYSYLHHRNDYILYNRYGLTIYKGIPIPIFDIMIFPDGGFRLVDKKHYFNKRDRNFLNRKQSDIILIGSGYRSLGGKGFPQQHGSQFVYNNFTGRGTQVIILNSPEACERFNRLKAQGKNVLFVLHTTC